MPDRRFATGSHSVARPGRPDGCLSRNTYRACRNTGHTAASSARPRGWHRPSPLRLSFRCARGRERRVVILGEQLLDEFARRLETPLQRMLLQIPDDIGAEPRLIPIQGGPDGFRFGGNQGARLAGVKGVPFLAICSTTPAYRSVNL